MITTQVVLNPGRERSILNRHPWIFSGAINRVEGDPKNGDMVDVWDHNAKFLARGIISLNSQIRIRILTWHHDRQVDRNFWLNKIERAVEGRASLAQSQTNAYRLIHAEADGIPGLIVDKYGDWLVAQFLSVAADSNKAIITEGWAELLKPKGIFERSDSYTRGLEGLENITGTLRGDTPPDLIEIEENGFRFLVDVKAGQKTGFFLDQRDNRQRAMPYLAGKDILNTFSYSGGFSVYGASVDAKSIMNVDTSEAAHKLAQKNMALNGFDNRDDIYSTADVFDVMRAYRDRRWSFDTVILDPPKFARSPHQVKSASRGYKDINLLALKLLRPGGTLITFSCSGAVDELLFQKILFGAAVDANRSVQIIERLHQGIDHPVLVTFPESAYLKGFICRVY